MKVRLMFSVLCALAVMGAFTSVKAQSPDQQLGFGVSLGTGMSSGTIAYALSPGMHIGTSIALGVKSTSSGGTSVSENSVVFAPYFKALLKGSKDFVPFIMGQFSISSSGSGNVSSTKTMLGVLGGAEYFASKNLGIYGSLSVLELGFDPSVTAFGVGLNANIGIEWFM